MRRILLSLLTLLPLLTLSARAQGDSLQRQMVARWEAHKGDFDYLLGDWSFRAVSREHGSYGGFWSAVRLDAGGSILDEFRVTGDTGETWHKSSTLRSYNAAADQWELVTVDEGRGLRDIGTARRVGNEVHIEQTFGATSPQPSIWRIRYYDIRPESFAWAADRSTDGGRTWVRDHMRIEARRIGPPRNLPALAPARR